MTTDSTDDHSATTTTTTTTPSPEPPTRRRLGGPTTVTLAVTIVGAVVAAAVTPLGDRVMNSFFDEPTCPGEACEGKNPQSQGCGEDARSLKPAVNNPAQLQIRYSEACGAVWARIQSGNPGDVVMVEVLPGRTARSAEVEYDHDKFTHMVTVPDGEFQATACVIPKPGGDSTFDRYCVHATEATAWR
ncbi:DUF2690 domain-containing protein [Streptomyces sp. NPDC006997]|uniref:DUF2690 domain-containing protein n=1 Tax=Streptomyces sp. NPDC006997 TaxID=3155356 RepID=UPI0033CD6AB7